MSRLEYPKAPQATPSKKRLRSPATSDERLKSMYGVDYIGSDLKRRKLEEEKGEDD